ncbi:MAG: adaptor protein MecA [Ruminococcaceae bacterium]|nr:adaptor protein MecA [Oscillospiraceae bacterium]
MELIKISDSKLKVMLSAEDMRDFDLDNNMNSTRTKEVFRSLMREAKARCGFNGLEGKVFVQLYRSKAGGCELFVTKLTMSHGGSECGAEGGKAERTRREEQMGTEYRQYLEEKVIKSRHVIYRFDEMSNLLSICAVLLASGYRGNSAAYAEPDRDGFYLALDSETFAAGEHFGKLCPSSFYYYINEHCRMFCHEAVDTLGKLA